MPSLSGARRFSNCLRESNVYCLRVYPLAFRVIFTHIESISRALRSRRLCPRYDNIGRIFSIYYLSPDSNLLLDSDPVLLSRSSTETKATSVWALKISTSAEIFYEKKKAVRTITFDTYHVNTIVFGGPWTIRRPAPDSVRDRTFTKNNSHQLYVEGSTPSCDFDRAVVSFAGSSCDEREDNRTAAACRCGFETAIVIRKFAKRTADHRRLTADETSWTVVGKRFARSGRDAVSGRVAHSVRRARRLGFGGGAAVGRHVFTLAPPCSGRWRFGSVFILRFGGIDLSAATCVYTYRRRPGRRRRFYRVGARFLPSKWKITHAHPPIPARIGRTSRPQAATAVAGHPDREPAGGA